MRRNEWLTAEEAEEYTQSLGQLEHDLTANQFATFMRCRKKVKDAR